MFEAISHWPPLILILAFAVAGWVVIKWGPVVLFGYALWHLALGDWTAAGLALAFAWFLQFLKAPIALYDALIGRRGSPEPQ